MVHETWVSQLSVVPLIFAPVHLLTVMAVEDRKRGIKEYYHELLGRGLTNKGKYTVGSKPGVDSIKPLEILDHIRNLQEF